MITHERSDTSWFCAGDLGRRSAVVVVLSSLFGVAVPGAAQGVIETAKVSAYTFTPERVVASLSVLAALVSAVSGVLAVARSARRLGTGTGRPGAVVALVLGPIAAVVGGLVVATADGGLGTGNGLGGGMVAVMLGLLGTTLGALALTRSRRIPSSLAVRP